MKSRIFLHFIINRPTTNNQKRILKEYPAHLHIDIVPEFQRKGIGKKLIEHLEKYLKRMNIQGYHLEVDPKNIVGVSFYKKLRLELLNSNRFTLTFGKKWYKNRKEKEELFVLQGCMSCRKTSNRNTEGTSGNIVETYTITEINRLRIPTLFEIYCYLFFFR